MGNLELLENIYKLIVLNIKHKISSKTSTILSNLYITVPREYMRDEVIIASIKTSQNAYKFRREMDIIMEKIEQEYK